MASLILNGDTLRVTLQSRRVEVLYRVSDERGERQETSQVPLFDIERVLVVGRPAVTLPVLTRLMDEGIPCFFVMYEQAMTRRFAPAKGAPHTDLRKVIDDQVCAYVRMLESGSEEGFFILP